MPKARRMTQGLRKGALGALFGLLAAPVLAQAAPNPQAKVAPVPQASETVFKVPDAARFIAASQNAYGRQLRDMRDEYKTRQMQPIPIAVLDPDAYTALKAAGMESYEAVGFMASRQLVVMTPTDARDMGFRMTKYISKDESVIYSEPYAIRYIPDIDPDAKGCLIVPLSISAASLFYEGLTLRENMLLVNRHEFWHCLDNSGNEEQGAREAFADLGAVTDMILRDKVSPTVIDRVARTRQRDLSVDADADHMSAYALLALKREIAGMGMRRFAAMSERDRQALLQRLARENTLDSFENSQIKIFSVGAISREDMLARIDPEAREKVAFYVDTYALSRQNPSQFPALILSESQTAALDAFDAEGMLRRAGTKRGQLTMLSLTSARTALVGDLRKQIMKDPENLLLSAKITKIDDVFIDMMRDRSNFMAPVARAPAYQGTTLAKPSA